MSSPIASYNAVFTNALILTIEDYVNDAVTTDPSQRTESQTLTINGITQDLLTQVC